MPDAEAKFKDKRVRAFLKKVDNKASLVKKKKKQYALTLSPIVFRDIIDHFQKEMGPRKRWEPWTTAYRNHLAKIGKSGNKILQDLGRLRNSFIPTNFRNTAKGLVWFNPAKTRTGFPYAAHHDENARKTRPFMWLSKKAVTNMANQTLKFLVDER